MRVYSFKAAERNAWRRSFVWRKNETGQSKMNPKEFTDQIRQARKEKRRFELLPKVPAVYAHLRQIIEDFDKTRIAWSPSGMTAHVLALWCRANNEGFSIHWTPRHDGSGVFTIVKTTVL